MVMTTVLVMCFFFSSRRRHTRYWRDWSSDVCSSDLLEEEYEADPEELELHQRELSPTIYGTSPFAVDETLARLREALQEADVEIIDELDLSSLLDAQRTYKVLLAADREFLQLAGGEIGRAHV